MEASRDEIEAKLHYQLGEYKQALELWMDIGDSGEFIKVQLAIEETIKLIGKINDIEFLEQVLKWLFQLEAVEE